MSFQLSQRPDLPCSIHKFTSPLITISGIKAPDYVSRDFQSDTSFINWANVSANVSKCLSFPGLTIRNQRTAHLLSNSALSFNTAATESYKNEWSNTRIIYTKHWSYDTWQHIGKEPKAFSWECSLNWSHYFCKRILKQKTFVRMDDICMQMHWAVVVSLMAAKLHHTALSLLLFKRKGWENTVERAQGFR